ncbi:MAG: hypothetical protein A2736_01170 [Candidatus Yanofskybacteria bacterium RIFCSPHIGHO2_01_FULL_41_27]|uniref:Uncharacterized protein n=3 Tax=Parcubacteria group TaxID=1794811 RepID=A0A0G1LPW3_9BACT|nr:MAG: hypothetical protein UW55_C0020G0003 [Candidatus Giovannonibacteria bacterium GW2011_GWA2_44_26]KKU16383.1 MAG: hypothetical protein UX24_C0011G0008 [Candidatus Giovannonibacteria bacterium GW2011_GWB1_45_9b]OGM98842.1 MAG: hypothetical protein A2736_01170 [Candidatus Yanofskybacteria bacterium RIFCSPHIGHO2_01_FULL_41_27]OGN10200.1 MAG: hypothetical protein A3C64_00710 [Candidatus Yanofskybacteria bacterium RIFCSPHIGHO2_02_FULL_41_12]OGN21416.1 MAG: hypothetical protein A3B00_00355 [Can
MAKEYWLKCDKIGPGMFPSERTFYVTDGNRRSYSGFLWEGEVDEKNRLIKVHIVMERTDGMTAFVNNPSWAFCGPSAILVTKDQLVEKEVPD